MNKNLVVKSIKLCYEKCPLDSVFLILVSLIFSILPAVILLMYNRFISSLSGMGDGNVFLSVMLMMCYCTLNFIQELLFHFYHHYYLNYHSLLKFEKKMKINFFHICLALNLEDYLSPEIVNETRRAQNASINIFRLYQIVVEIAASIIEFILIGSVVVYVHYTLLFSLILAVVPSIADQIYKIIQKKFLLYQNTQKQKEEEEYFKFLTRPEHMKEIKVLKCFDFIFSKWLGAHQSILELERKSQTKQFVVSLIFNFIKVTGTIGAYWSITALFIKQEINLAEFSMIILTFSKLTQSILQLFSLFGNLSEFSIRVKPYFIFVEKLSEKKQKGSAVCEKDAVITLDNLSFRYPNSDVWILKNISLAIRRGEFISIVGENGAGKTTFSKILLGFLTPTKGQVCLGNHTDKEAAAKESLKNIAYIPQNFQCYCISIKDNIVFGNDVKDGVLEQLFDMMHLTDLKEEQESLYGLEFGGMELSGGQKQKIAILRATLKKADLLIFDEPTSAIDPLQESLIYRALLEISKGKTTIMVSHRLALTRYSDRIIVLKEGRILEMGDYESLMEKDGEYARMWKAQAELYL